MQFHIVKRLFGAMAGGMLLALLLPVTNVYAALPSFPTSGTCAALLTGPVPYGATVPAVATYNLLIEFTFTSSTGGTVDVSRADFSYTSSGIGNGSSSGGVTGNTLYISDPPGGSNLPAGAKILQFQDGASHIWGLIAVAVNGGKTLLLQGDPSALEPLSGVCQF